MTATYKSIEHIDIDNAVSMMRDFYSLDGYPMDIPLSKKLFSEFIENERLGKAWIISYDDQSVGYVIMTLIFSFEFKGRIAFIDELYISEAARGKGIGKQTVDFIKAEAKALSVKMLYLEVEHHNTNAQKLYLSSGFKIHNRKFMQYEL